MASQPHQYLAGVRWQRNGASFIDNQYSRAHRWQFDGGLSVPASASPHIVPVPHSLPQNVDPEEAFVAALASCHMLFFLSFAAKAKILLDAYTDDAFGVTSTQSAKPMIERVVLRPKVVLASGVKVSRDRLERLHHLAHEHCFIANSVKSEVRVEPSYE